MYKCVCVLCVHKLRGIPSYDEHPITTDTKTLHNICTYICMYACSLMKSWLKFQKYQVLGYVGRRVPRVQVFVGRRAAAVPTNSLANYGNFPYMKRSLPITARWPPHTISPPELTHPQLPYILYVTDVSDTSFFNSSFNSSF